jgi:hypothetical protein
MTDNQRDILEHMGRCYEYETKEYFDASDFEHLFSSRKRILELLSEMVDAEMLVRTKDGLFTWPPDKFYR